MRLKFDSSPQYQQDAIEVTRRMSRPAQWHSPSLQIAVRFKTSPTAVASPALPPWSLPVLRYGPSPNAACTMTTALAFSVAVSAMLGSLSADRSENSEAFGPHLIDIPFFVAETALKENVKKRVVPVRPLPLAAHHCHLQRRAVAAAEEDGEIDGRTNE